MKGRSSYHHHHHHQGNYTNPCLTMHQPWASLLVHGIKRVEGRSWPAPIRGRLWIHAASKVPDDETVKAMEDFYREVYAVNGITDIKFPEHYPISRLIGCVEVVGCVRGEELASWEAVPVGVRLEGLTDFCWLCEQPQKLLVPFEMRGYQKVYNLEKKIYEAAVRGLMPVQSPLPVKFPLPNQLDLFSLKPGSISIQVKSSKPPVSEESSSLNAAIAGAKAAATQFSKRDATPSSEVKPTLQASIKKDNIQSAELLGKSLGTNKLDHNGLQQCSAEGASLSNEKKQIGSSELRVSGRHNQISFTEANQHQMASPKLFSAALKGLRNS